jgi:hypothetical protein
MNLPPLNILPLNDAGSMAIFKALWQLLIRCAERGTNEHIGLDPTFVGASVDIIESLEQYRNGTHTAAECVAKLDGLFPTNTIKGGM